MLMCCPRFCVWEAKKSKVIKVCLRTVYVPFTQISKNNFRAENVKRSSAFRVELWIQKATVSHL